jgi:hypothetical protein
VSWQFEKDKDVVCICSDWKSPLGPTPLRPELGRIYHVRDIKMASELPHVAPLVNKIVVDHLMLQLAETRGWASAIGFRPVRNTDIKELEQLLAPPPKQLAPPSPAHT